MAKSPNRDGAAVAESMGSRLVAHKTVVLCLRHGAPLPSLFVAFDPCTSHAGAGGARSRAICIKEDSVRPLDQMTACYTTPGRPARSPSPAAGARQRALARTP